MAENDDPDVIDYEVDGYAEDPGGGGFNAGGSIQIEVTAFDLNAALAGRVMYAKATENNQSKYYIATQFDDKSTDKRYPYRAKVNGKLYNFNSDGQTSTGLYTLYMAKSNISGTGAEQGDSYDPDPSGHGSASEWDVYYMTGLNYRETVAAGVLNSIIGHMPDPLSYDSTKISLLVKKSFDFAVEFMNQAYTLRLSNATQDDQGNIHIDPAELSPADAAIVSISSALYTTVEEGGQQVKKSIFTVMKDDLVKEMQDALSMEITEGSNVSTKSITEVLYDSVSELTDIKDILDPAVQNSLGAKLANMDSTLGNMKLDLDAIKTANEGIETALTGSGGTGLMSTLAAISSNTGTTASRLLDSHNISVADRLAGIGTDTDSIRSHTNQIDGKTELISQYVDGVEGKLDSLIYNTRNVDGIGNDTDVIRQKVTSIDNKVQ